jgi:hypothetical protein
MQREKAKCSCAIDCTEISVRTAPAAPGQESGESVCQNGLQIVATAGNLLSRIRTCDDLPVLSSSCRIFAE